MSGAGIWVRQFLAPKICPGIKKGRILQPSSQPQKLLCHCGQFLRIHPRITQYGLSFSARIENQFAGGALSRICRIRATGRIFRGEARKCTCQIFDAIQSNAFHERVKD